MFFFFFHFTVKRHTELSESARLRRSQRGAMEEHDKDQKEDETQETNGQSKPGKTASAVCVTDKSGDFHPVAIENYSRMTSHLARGRLRRRHAAGLCAYLLTAGADTFDIFCTYAEPTWPS